MGALGSDAAIEAADVVLMDDNPAKIATAMRISRKTLRIVKQNIWFALGVKGAVLLLGAFGAATMWEAVFADVGVAFIAILNAMRCLHVDEFRKYATAFEVIQPMLYHLFCSLARLGLLSRGIFESI